MRHTLPAAFALIMVVGCAPTPPPLSERPVREPAGQCNASGAQEYIGQRANSQTGAQILAATGSAALRWGPPRSAMTMDYRPDRVTVAYDDDLVIQRVVCG